MAPCVAGSRRERVRWRARKALVDGFADTGFTPAQALQQRLQRAVLEARRRVLEDAPLWHTRTGHAPELRVPKAYFADFVEQVVRTINRHSEHEARDRIAGFQKRLEENMHGYLQELDVYNERLAPAAKHPRTVSRKVAEEELYLYEPLQYWDEDQRLIMQHIIQERLRRLLPNLAGLLEAGASKLRDEELARALALEEEEEDDGECDPEAVERRQRDKEKRKRRDDDLKARQAHDAAMAKAAQDAKNLERANEELRLQLQALSQALRAAEKERDKARAARDKLQSEAESKAKRRSDELERVRKQTEKLQQEAGQAAAQAEATAAKAAADAKAEAAGRAAAEAASEAVPGQMLFSYAWAEHLAKPLPAELEDERVRLGLSKQEWEARLVITNKHGKQMALPSNWAVLQGEFVMVVKLQAPLAATKVVNNMPKAKPPNKDELARQVAAAMRAIEEEQERERARLLARIKELEDAIARLQGQLYGMSDEASDQSASKKATKKGKSRPEELQKSSGDNWKRGQGKACSGEVEILKAAVVKHRTSTLFERLHGDASQRAARFVAQQPVAEDIPGQFQLNRSSSWMEKQTAAPPPQLAAACALMSRSKAKSSRQLRDEEASSKEESLSKCRRPTSAANLTAISKPKKRGSSATAERSAAAANWLKAGWGKDPAGQAARLDNLVPSGPMTLESVLQQRAAGELSGWGQQTSMELRQTGRQAPAEFLGSGQQAAGQRLPVELLGRSQPAPTELLGPGQHALGPQAPAELLGPDQRVPALLLPGRQHLDENEHLQRDLDAAGQVQRQHHDEHGRLQKDLETAGHPRAAEPIHADVGLPAAAAALHWGSSVLHNRTPAELAGPSRQPLLRSVFEQHIQALKETDAALELRPS